MWKCEKCEKCENESGRYAMKKRQTADEECGSVKMWGMCQFENLKMGVSYLASLYPCNLKAETCTLLAFSDFDFFIFELLYYDTE